MEDKTPVVIITGYLGAGKTTLLQHIISQTKEKKIAILMNEFGNISIDSKIIKGDNIDMTELAGGCVCCSLTGELEAAIKEIKEKINPELVIIETTGVAEPDTLTGVLEDTIEGVKIDSIITIADADALDRYPNLGHTGLVQLEIADIILLNKTDLVEKEKVQEITEELKHLNTTALIIPTIKCNVGVNKLIGLHTETKKADHTNHEIEIDVFSYTTNNTLDKQKFKNFLANLPEQIFRFKGFVNLPETHFVNCVAGRHELEKSDIHKTELVFIGKGIQSIEQQIKSALRECE